MNEEILPQHDKRTLDELVNVALTEPDEDIAWDAVAAIHWRGTTDVLHRAQSLCRSGNPRERRLGADILGQLGVPDRTFPNECAEALFAMLDSEGDAEVLQAIFIAFSHLADPRVVSVASRYAVHPDPDVRHAVAVALSRHENQTAIDLLIALTNDSDPNLRDWATFGLGTQLKSDTPEIRNALAARLEDSDDDARGEAMIGLARRKDRRAIPAIQKDLNSCGTLKALEAAELSQSPELIPALLALRDSVSLPPPYFDDVIAACSPR